ncbi:MAG: hypothetical protein V7K47_20505 [Nostoc sp.]
MADGYSESERVVGKIAIAIHPDNLDCGAIILKSANSALTSLVMRSLKESSNRRIITAKTAAKHRTF